MQKSGATIAVLGAGAWGTALAFRLAENGLQVKLWGRDQVVADQINTQHSSPFLPSVNLPDNLIATTDLGDSLKDISYLLIAVPSHAFDSVCEKVSEYIDLANVAVVWATKGIDPNSNSFLSQLLNEKYHVKTLALVSGPSFAIEVGLKKPTAVNIVSEQQQFQQGIASDFSAPSFRVYCSDDLIGSQICAIYKNVLAIAAGACDGSNMGYNARAALLTRGLEEMRRLVVAMGGQENTVYGLCGLGDLLLTATGDLSRNRRFGLAISQYPSIAEAAKAVGKTIEGKSNIEWLLDKAKPLNIELPICAIVDKVLHEAITIQEAIETLLERNSK